MRISFHGAAREVTGSCYLVETDRARILVDCGMFQGTAFADAKNFRDFGFDPATIDAVAVTHAHLDHVGRIPKLVKEGFRGKIFSTPPTAKLARIVMEDAERVMDEDAHRQFRPKLFDEKDVLSAVKHFSPVDYSRRVTVGDLTLRFRDAGHILGSSFIEIEEAGGARVAFSGDLGNGGDPILRPTAQLAEQDLLVMESTYGNRIHEPIATRAKQLGDAITSVAKKKGVLLIPAFAIERTQLLLYELNHLVEKRLVPPVDIFLDSPMAIRASEVFQEYPQYYNKDALHLVSEGDDLFTFPGLRKTLTRDESKMINEAPRPKVIIAGAGMMNAGRILHHLVRYLGDPKTTVLIVGYQSEGTLGRKLYSGERHVEVLSERINVKAEIRSIGAFSAHADQRQLLAWLGAAARPPKMVLCTHGEEGSAAAMATRITDALGIPADVPRFEDVIDTAEGPRAPLRNHGKRS